MPLTVFIASVGQEGHTGDAVVGTLVEATGGDEYSLEPWYKDLLIKLAGRIHDLYCTAYGLTVPFESKVVDYASESLDEDDLGGSGVVRAFIKQYVATLDVIHGPANNDGSSQRGPRIADEWHLDRRLSLRLERTWPAFFARFGRLTPVQRAVIEPVVSGASVLVCAPTAAGKTEAACAPLMERFVRRGE